MRILQARLSIASFELNEKGETMAQKIYIVTLTDENGGFTDYERRCPTDTEVTYCPDISTAESIERDFFEAIAETDDYQSWLA